MNPFKNFKPFKRWAKRNDTPPAGPPAKVAAVKRPTPQQEATAQLAFSVVDAAIIKATQGRKTKVSQLTGTERRRVRRILERRARRLNGEPVGMTAPSIAARRKAPSSFRASL